MEKRFILVLKILLTVRTTNHRSKRYIDYSRYTYEFYWVGLFLFAIIFFFKGRSTNDHVATTFNKGIADVISSQFSHFGTQKDPSLALE